MRIVEIAALENGAHRNQTVDGEAAIPDGWALIPDDMETENFPFGDLEAEEVAGVMTVTAWTPGTVPDPGPEPDPSPTTEEKIAALEQENKLLTQQVSALSDQNDFQEELIVELANIVYA